MKYGLRLKPGARNGGKAHGRTRQKRVLNHDANIDRLTDGACTTARDAFGFCLIDRKDQRDGSRIHEVLPRSGSRAVITLGKKSDLAAYRQAMSFITREDVCKKLFKEIAPSYAERNGGYTRVIRTGVRRGDAAETAIIELVK